MRPAITTRIRPIRRSTAGFGPTRWLLIVAGTTLSLLMVAVMAIGASAQTVTEDGAEQGDEPNGSAVIGGKATHRNGEPVAGLRVELFTAAWPDTPDAFLRPAFTAADGGYVFTDLPADCYLVVFHAPTGTSYGEGASSTAKRSCVDPGQSDLTVDAGLSSGRPGEPFDLTILHIGDHHGHLQPQTMDLELDGRTVRAEVGGFPRLVTMIEQRTEAIGSDRVVTVHAGNALTGTIFYTVFGGAADAAMMNEACFDIFGLGAQELDRGHESLGIFLDFLAAGSCGTITLGPPDAGAGDGTSAEELGVPATTTASVRTIGDDSVGFITGPPATTAGPDEDPAADIQARIDELEAQGVGNIVLVSTAGLEADRALVSQLVGLDVIVGSGSNSLLGDFENIGLAVDGPYPLVTTAADGNTVCIAHAWQNGRLLGELNARFDGQGHIVGCGGTAHLLLGETFAAEARPEEGVAPSPEQPAPWLPVSGAELQRIEAALETRPELTVVAPDPEAQTALDGYVRALDQLTAEIVGTATSNLCLTRIPGRTVGLLCGTGQAVSDTTDLRSDVQRLVADALRSRGGGEIAIIDSGSIRSEMVAGPFSIADTYRLVPDGHRLTMLTMTGAEISAVLEQAIEAAVGAEGSTAAYPHTSGLRWKADLAGPIGDRVGPLEVLRTDDDGASQRWEALEPAADYLVVTTDFLSEGGRGYTALAKLAADGRSLRSGVEYAQALTEYIDRQLEGVIPPPDLGPPADASRRN